MLFAPPCSSSSASGSSWLLGVPWTTISLAGSLDNRISGSSSVPEGVVARYASDYFFSNWKFGLPWVCLRKKW